MGIESTRITSESLQAAIRQLLPSQVGFGDDLHATNLIQPVIDLTATAEGSGLDVSLQQAMSHGSSTSFDVEDETSTLVANTGFFRVFGSFTILSNAASARVASFQVTDGATTKKLVEYGGKTLTGGIGLQGEYDFIVFLIAGDSLTCTSNSNTVNVKGSTRQVATVTGTLVNPVGFTSE